MLRNNRNNPSVIGIDIGGSHITAGCVHHDSGYLDSGTLVRRKVDTHAPADIVIDSWSEVIREVSKRQEVLSSKLGIAIPGPFDYQNGISRIKDQGKFDALYGQNIKKVLAGQLAMKEESIHLMNDAGCFLRGEVFGGAAKGFTRAIGVTLGTGLGTAKYIEGAAEDADLWKHSFKDGIAEDYLCSRWFVNTYYQLSGLKVNGVKDLVELSGSDPLIRKIFETFSINLAEFLVFFIREENPDVVVLGGNIANAYPLFINGLKRRLAVYEIGLPIRKAELGEKAAMIGAASYWIERTPDIL